jgi:hypothetical protein
MYDKVVKIEFNVWADSEQEGEELKKAIVDFINWHGERGRKVSASRLTEALKRWQDNVLARNSIIKHFS